jgi:HSP20 family protein
MRDFGTLQNEVNRVFADLGFSPPGQNAASPEMGANLTTAPRLDVVTTENGGYEIHVDLPGLEDKDIDLSVDGDLLTLRGERRQERDEARRNYRVRERAFGTFSRTIALPFEARPEQIDAEFKNGVLTIRVERPREPERSGSKVNIRSRGGRRQLRRH